MFTKLGIFLLGGVAGSLIGYHCRTEELDSLASAHLSLMAQAREMENKLTKAQSELDQMKAKYGSAA